MGWEAHRVFLPLADSIRDVLSSNLVPLVLGAIALTLLMSSLSRRQQARAARPKPPAQRPPPSADSREQEIRRDLDELMVELQELSRRISAEIDTRFSKLEAAIRDADRRIAVLNRLSRMLAEQEGKEAPASTDIDARHSVIYELADAGFTPVEIARDLGKTPGEVELILNLRKNLRAAPRS
mgnify:CR=1 FL=1